jgi:uncharacterized membrane protein YdfJ with MMPL/SSD domain
MNINNSSARSGVAVLKWLVILAFVALSAVAGFFYLSDSNARAELDRAQRKALESDQQLQELQQAQTPAQPKPSEDNNTELVRLRGEVAKARSMEKQYQATQTENQQLKAQIQQLQQVNAEAAALRSQNAQFLATAQDQTFMVQCVANLRNIANAKAQWAAQNGKRPTDMPLDVDIFGKYLPQKPVCPKGGIYTLGPVSGRPTCTAPGHTM